MRSLGTPFLIVALIGPNGFAESGSLCIAPVFVDAKPLIVPGLDCEADKISLKIDTQVMAWPIKESVKLSDLDLTTRHRVMVFCDHKPQQSFAFRFSQFKTH